MGIPTKLRSKPALNGAATAPAGSEERDGRGGLRARARRWIPAQLEAALRSADTAARQRLYRLPHLSTWLRDALADSAASAQPRADRRRCLTELVAWLKRAQDAVGGRGVAAYYSFAQGWSAAYPETTGYIIVTCLEASERLVDPDLAVRAHHLADWELEVQMPEGAWQSGLVSAPPVPAVFNTGQVIQGLLGAYRAFGEPRYLEAAVRGGHWLVAQQDTDGAWRRHTYRGFPNSYSTRVAWPLLDLADVTGDRRLRESAVSYLEWAARRQDDSGWLEQCSLEPDEPALTHTLAYTMEGFLESGVLLREDRWLHVAQRTADALLHRYEVRRHLAGAYDRGWRGDHSYACLTGCAQVALVWCRLFQLTGDPRYLNAALKLNDFVAASIDLRSAWPEIRGAVKGSHPVWGHYMRFRFPSWAVKFTVDAFLREEQALAGLEDRD
jgi:hypothetical protein